MHISGPVILFIAATGLLTLRKSMGKLTAWLMMLAGPPIFLFSRMASEEVDPGPDGLLSVIVVFVVLYCVIGSYLSRKLPAQYAAQRLDNADILLLLLCQPALCLLVFRLFPLLFR